MSLTKKKAIYILSVLFVLLLFGVGYLILSGVKKEAPVEPRPEITLNGLIPGQSTREDVVRLKGSPTLSSTAENVELLKYELKEVDDSNTYAISDGVLFFYVEGKDSPEPFSNFSKTRGNGTLYYEEDEEYVWHMYPTKGLGLTTIGEDVVRTLVFSPMNPEEFDSSIAYFLGLSKTVIEHIEIIPELE